MSKVNSKSPRKDPNVYPPGWNYERAKAVADYYDARKDQDLLDEAETSQSHGTAAWMEVPHAIIPKVLELIAKHEKSSRSRKRLATAAG